MFCCCLYLSQSLCESHTHTKKNKKKLSSCLPNPQILFSLSVWIMDGLICWNKILALYYFGIMGLWVRAAGVEDVQYKCLVSSQSYEPLSRTRYVYHVELGHITMCTLWSYSTAVVSYTSRTDCKLIKCFTLAQCWRFIGYYVGALLGACHPHKERTGGVTPNYSRPRNLRDK